MESISKFKPHQNDKMIVENRKNRQYTVTCIAGQNKLECTMR
jgi:hypothetical protein